MAFNFNKNIVVGVSVSPAKGLEIAQIDFSTKTVLKYGNKPLLYDNNRKIIADLDIFKETLSDLLFELQIPKGSEIVLNLPTISFKVTDYPASLDETQVLSAIEEELAEHPLFKDTDAAISQTRLASSTMQFNKIAYSALQKTMLIEIAMQLKELGYSIKNINTSVDATLAALIYNGRIQAAHDSSWSLLIIENNYCRILPMIGNNCTDSYEERISIGEVLGDAENYSTVCEAVNPILKILPAQHLYVISKTDLISAKVISEKLTFKGQIIHQDANCFALEPFIDVAPSVDDSLAKEISLDVIGAAIYSDIYNYLDIKFNLYNATLGDIYTSEQPLEIKIGSKTHVFSVENAIKICIKFAVPLCVSVAVVCYILSNAIAQQKVHVANIEKDIKEIENFLEENSDLSVEEFNETEQIQFGVEHNKEAYTYYTIVGTEIPKKLWLTSLELGEYTTIEGQADNLESVYSFFRNIKDYTPNSKIKLQKLGLANNKSKVTTLNEDGTFDTDSILSSMEADFYSFKISDAPEVKENEQVTEEKNKKGKAKTKSKSKKKTTPVIDLEPIE